ncbi:UDP-N-acetylglucosamine 2-epimerase (non-hydrolyzing) [Geomonas oryzisoli]|uniref:UDP-N-acetylglucosamine 2-epimerase (non-hydrolyzing) n=2 Tax=Geomonas oryzisoli TaxID=2847992 RepID=A0ABX8JCY7_9BACT|nr:UDP-N-acetylglucosamine 2-epimerase (non-hydrolyzing) [Geomonas oryzisoli]
MVVIGTRPEAIKMAPVVRELQQRTGLKPVVVATSQHKEMLHQALAAFDITPDLDLDVMKPGQDLEHITCTVLERLAPLVREIRPDAMLVHGDTTTAMAASLVGYYNGVMVGHVEAGLRSFDKQAPYPEEVNRRIVGVVADWHFAPTSAAAGNLAAEGVTAASVAITGNTIVDAVQQVSRKLLDDRRIEAELSAAGMRHWDKRIILVTGHRRENLDGGIERMCTALARITDELEDVVVVYPVHLNPRVKDAVNKTLSGRDRVLLMSPLGYEPFVYLMAKATLIVTDSGGIQEEAAALSKPVLITRTVTERPEVVEAGIGILVGTEPEAIYSNAVAILADREKYDAMSSAVNPFGDGFAAARICDFLQRALCAR